MNLEVEKESSIRPDNEMQSSVSAAASPNRDMHATMRRCPMTCCGAGRIYMWLVQNHGRTHEGGEARLKRVTFEKDGE